ncbi:hypothetical protein TNCV_1585171 [Trichonephila clavipes]|nr:hypothetical protein TNCV_1585171 [Trichonephila clavipes]
MVDPVPPSPNYHTTPSGVRLTFATQHGESSAVLDRTYVMPATRSITRISTFMDNVSEHVDITELEVKLKKIDQLQRKIEELKELLLD